MKKTLIISLCFALILGTLGCAGMPTIQWKSTTQKQVASLAVSIGAKAIGLKLAATGFIWTEEIELFYRTITEKDTLSLDAAKMAEGYIRDNVDPLIAPDILELAKMVGFEFNTAGTVIGTSNVNVELLKIAANGFRLAITTRQNAGNNTQFPELTGPFYPEGDGTYHPVLFPSDTITLLPFILLDN